MIMTGSSHICQHHTSADLATIQLGHYPISVAYHNLTVFLYIDDGV